MPTVVARYNWGRRNMPMIVSALVALSVASTPSCKTADPRIESLVASYARKTQSDEYCQTRIYHTIDDLDGDGKDDFVLVFSLEVKAGNDSAQYLAVFLSTKAWTPLVLKVGERGERLSIRSMWRQNARWC